MRLKCHYRYKNYFLNTCLCSRKVKTEDSKNIQTFFFMFLPKLCHLIKLSNFFFQFSVEVDCVEIIYPLQIKFKLLTITLPIKPWNMVTNFLGCMRLKTGGIIIGVFSVLATLVDLVYETHKYFTVPEDRKGFITLCTIIGLALGFFIDYLLINGAMKVGSQCHKQIRWCKYYFTRFQTRSGFLIPWLVFTVFVLFVGLFKTIIITFSSILSGFLYLISLCLVIYCWVVISSLFIQIEDSNKEKTITNELADEPVDEPGDDSKAWFLWCHLINKSN